MKTIDWENIARNFNFLNIEYAGEKRGITSTRMTRVGLELSGFFPRKKSTSCILFGNEEFLYLQTFSEEQRNEKIENIFKLQPPVIILSRSFPASCLLEFAKKYDTTVLSSDSSSSEINTLINLHLLRELSETHLIHGNLVEVFGLGVLLLGESGIGKSEITLELLRKGHLFVCDDAVEYYRVFDKIVGRTAEITKNLIEIRGMGIVDISKMYGIQQIKSETSIDVIIELSVLGPEHEFDRLGNEVTYRDLSGIKIPYYKLPISPGRNISYVIEMIVNKQKLLTTTRNDNGLF